MTLKDILARRDEVFKDEIGCVKGIKAKLPLKQDAVITETLLPVSNSIGITFPLTHGLIQIESFPCE
jgi:hypothetical protein